MKIVIVTPESLDTTLGNSITAGRWAGILRTLGHEVEIAREWNGQDCDLLVALHTRRSHESIQRFGNAQPDRPLVAALTGTDLYRDLPTNTEARQSLLLATRIVALQNAALDRLDEEARAKTHVIYQSATAPPHRDPPKENSFEVCVLSHLREVKDPLRAAFASRHLPAQSRIRITHAGRPLEAEIEAQAKAEELANSQYRWIGEQSHDAAMQLLARSRLMVLSSAMEGGASAIAEAVVCGVPILCSDIPGNIGMLEPDYPGYFRLRDTEQLAELLNRAEMDANFHAILQGFVLKLQPRFSPEGERASWNHLLQSL